MKDMAEELIERLRARAKRYEDGVGQICEDAAAEIENLRSEREVGAGLRKAALKRQAEQDAEIERLRKERDDALAELEHLRSQPAVRFTRRG